MAAPQEFRWPCAACGADLTFAPGQSDLVCGHCGHVQTIPETPESDRRDALRELDLHAALDAALPVADTVEVRLSRCTSCGAEIEFSAALHARECPFCASPIVTDTGSERHIKPQAVIPFAVSERDGRAAMVRWLGRLWFAPNGLQEYARKGRSLTGIYVPYWTFDAATRSRYLGQRGTWYYETRTVTVEVNGKREQRQERVRKTRWTSATGAVARFFDDVLVLASKSLPRRHTDGLAPWDLAALEPYRPDFLSGFQAEGYTVDLPDGHQSAREIMAAQIREDVRRAIGGDEQRIDRIDTIHENETFKHILLPVWTAAYRYNGKSYRFVVNGQTGKVQGERPWSAWKIAIAVVLGLAALAAAVLLGEHFG